MWEWLRESGARAVWEGVPGGDGFSCGCAGCQPPSPLPQRRELDQPRCRNAAEGRSTAQQTAAQGDDKHPAPAPPELLGTRSCLWCPARGGTPCRAPLPAEAGRTQPNGSGCSRVWQQLSARAGGCSRDGPPPAMPGQAVIPALTSASLWGEEHVERGVAAPRCMRGGHPSHANMPLWLFGTRHLRRSRPARSCTVGGSAAW